MTDYTATESIAWTRTGWVSVHSVLLACDLAGMVLQAMAPMRKAARPASCCSWQCLHAIQQGEYGLREEQ